MGRKRRMSRAKPPADWAAYMGCRMVVRVSSRPDHSPAEMTLSPRPIAAIRMSITSGFDMTLCR